MMALASCSHDHLYYETVGREKVQFNIDWSHTRFMEGSKDYDADNWLNGVTIFAFDAKTQHLYSELPPDPNWLSPVVRLDEGTYHMVLINDSRAELPAIKFTTDALFEDFCAYTEGDTVKTNYPDYLAVSTVSDVTFQPAQKDYYYDMPDEYYQDFVVKQINTVQRPVTKKINIRVYVKGMNYCRGMLPSYITGMSKSINLATRKPGREQTVYAFNLINREFRNSDYTEAILTQSFNSFGFSTDNLMSDTTFELKLNFVLVDNTTYTVTADVTKQFEDWYLEHKVEVDLDLDLDIDLDIDVNIEVELPPTVENPENVGGMAPETVPWNDIIQNIEL